MAIQATDLLLINRAGASFYVKYADILTKVQNTDYVLVNRNGASHKITGSRLKGNGFKNSDLFLVNRGGQSFKCPGGEFSFPFTKPTFQKAEWEFVSKDVDGSLFKLTLYWSDFNYIYRPSIDSFTIALLISDARGDGCMLMNGTNIGGSYDATNWSNSRSQGYVDINIGNDILTIDNTGGGSVSMLMNISNTITLQNGSTANAKNEFENKDWTGYVNMYYRGQTTVNEPQRFNVFNSPPNMFN